jgi:CRISPR-associated protein Csc1
MYFYRLDLTLHDNVFFASREMGTLYETEKYLHNWALSYALFEEIYLNRPYRLKGKAAQRPHYLAVDHEQSLHPLNQLGLYVFPANPKVVSYQINTFKAAQVGYYGKSKQFGGTGARKNYPYNFGRAKELAVGSTYCTYVTVREPTTLPRWMVQGHNEHPASWIRLGKWAAKIRVEVVPLSGGERRSGTFICTHPLNPLDLPPSTQLVLYNRVVMPPVSLVSQAQLQGEHWYLEQEDLHLPCDMSYGAGYGGDS